MPTIFEFSLQPCINYLDGFKFTHHASANGNHVCIVVLFGKTGTLLIPTESTAYAVHLVCGHSLPVSASTKNDPQIIFPLSDTNCCWTYIIRIVY